MANDRFTVSRPDLHSLPSRSALAIEIGGMQRATVGASTSTAQAARSGGVLFVHRFGATLNAHVHLHLFILDGVVAPGRHGLAFRGKQVDEACVERVQALTWCGVQNM